ncbi:MAG: type II secretion system F family protein [Candidatus Omnitrophica bacterium]|nr:type II secretion system F family protein [Candidatus Omnitrophota bacterium]
MQKYIYTARDERGKGVKGMIMAENELELSQKISNLGYFLTSFKISQESINKVSETAVDMLQPKEVLQLTYQISTLLDAGLPLLNGLRNLAQDAANERIQRTIDDIRYRVESGISLKEALSVHPKSFSKLYQALVEAGESTGKLAETLNDLALLLEWQMDLKGKIKEAATYPIILFSVMIGVVTLMVVKVIPTFEPIFADFGAKLPLPTRLVLGVSHFVINFWPILIGLIITMVLGVIFYNRTESGHYKLDSLKLKMPLFGGLLRKIALSRFAHTFTICFDAGINLLIALEISQGTIGNSRIEQAVGKAKKSVNVGEKLAASLKMSGEFPSMVVRMIEVGEQSGNLTKTLKKVTEFYDKEVAATIKSIFALMEPIMIIIMGIVVGGIALAVFMPMFQLAEMVG